MSEFNAQVQISDLLTVFIQNFKNILSTKLSLIESLCINNNSLQSNPEFLFAKFSNKCYTFQWPSDPFSVSIGQESLLIIQRFYMRIEEYLEFRMDTLLSFEDTSINKQIEKFRKNLHKYIKSVENNISKQNSIGELFQQLISYEKIFVMSLIQIIQKRKTSTVKGLLNFELLKDVRKFIDDKISKQAASSFLDSKRVLFQQNVLRSDRSSLQTNASQNIRLKSLMRRKIFSKYEDSTQLGANLSSRDIYLEQGIWKEKQMSPQDETLDLEKYVQNQNRLRLKRVYDLLELEENTLKGFSKDGIFIELQAKNAKNKLAIQKYLKRYERKKRRSLRKQESEKGYKSTTKPSKYGFKNNEQNIPQMRVQSQQSYSKKKIGQNSKKYQALQLPLIVTKHGRRTTVEK